MRFNFHMKNGEDSMLIIIPHYNIILIVIQALYSIYIFLEASNR